jgi:hypothetical protein
MPTTYPAFGSTLSKTGGRPPLEGAVVVSMTMPRFNKESTIAETVGALS